ncbi:sugar ABC transporter substrate-binding protein [Kaistia sp. 32K]|uniref:ABC transporter substrate-binding protein n=1 Tax=Kaistia sp. 32K TaxID=2795690 RepID=UPI001936C06E|nr:extracellular solute-binding protein [Kaistia sp. 32K]BCP54230.1 sugar ABC transporter substrate-binding protein [Kaistia sp. 32K]
MNGLKKLSAALGVSLALAGFGMGMGMGAASAQDSKVFKIWWYEAPESAMAIAWNQAIEEFKAKHPDLTIAFEQKSWDQIEKAGSLMLNSNEAPDLMEYNKGNAIAGLAASQGLLTDLTDVAKERGWDKILTEGQQALGRYDDRGIFGGGPLIGVPDYGEFVTVYYNKDLFKANNLEVPTTFEEFETVLDAFVAKGITPIAEAANDYPAQHLLYELALIKADPEWVANYQGLKAPLDTAPYLYGAQKLQEWVQKGYVSKDATGLKAQDMANLFMAGKAPMIISGTWFAGEFKSKIDGFEWGHFLFPGKNISAGSTGNIWVVPKNGKNKELAYEFIDLTLTKANQALLGNSGGVPVAADPSDVTDPVGNMLTSGFKTLSDRDGLGFYPDWPAPGYYNLLMQKTQALIGGSLTPEAFIEAIAGPYNEAYEEAN